MEATEQSNPGQLMTQAAYARSRGVSKQAVNKLVKRKIIPVFGERGLVDPAIADLKIGQNLHPGRSKMVENTAGRPSQNGFSSPSGSSGSGSSGSNLLEARAMRETYEGLQSKLDYEKSIGLVVNREATERGIYEAARALRDAVLNVPRRCCADLVASGDPAKAEQLLSAELKRAFEDFNKLVSQKLSAPAN